MQQLLLACSYICGSSPPQASSSDGALTLDLIQEDDPPSDTRPPLCACAEASGKSDSLPREVQSPLVGKKSRCASIEQILTPQDHKDPKNHKDPKDHKDPPMVARLQELIVQKLQDTERMLTEVRGGGGLRGGVGVRGGAEAERILMEATQTWSQARDVLQEVKELQDLYRQL